MAKLTITRGLPGSGKSKWALEEAQVTGAVIVCKDDLRLQLSMTGWVWSPENEKTVILLRDKKIIEALKSGKDTISSDCNFGQRHERALRGIASECGAEFEIKDFTGVPISTCVERDSKRMGSACVGEKVIRGMAQANGVYEKVEPVKKYVPDLTKPRAIIVDLDGTASLFLSKGHRGPYDADKCDEDEVNPQVKYFLDLNLTHGDCKVIFLSGREDKFRDKTVKFLNEQYGYYGFPLFMRVSGDKRKDWIVKGEIFDREIRDKYNVFMCLDDRNQVVDFYRSLGLVVWQVAPGNF